ncbi:MAG: hypothetical protein HY801_08270, partial [Candidatus Lindowbacteria bacterium]|nr:hypothetical protein [Candidatus Lindowbacteria bacterium]
MKKATILLVLLTVMFCATPSAYSVEMGSISSAECRSGSFAFPSQTDTYTLSGQAGQTVVINMSTETGGIDPVISLYDPDGLLETSATCAPECFYTSLEGWQLSKSGLYTILVSDHSGNEAGDYSLCLLLIPGSTVSEQDPDGGDILSGETKPGQISPNADTDGYIFNGNAGDTARLDMSSLVNVDPSIYLYDPDGLLEASAFCYPECFHTTLEQQLLKSGVYTVVLKDGQGNETDQYSFSFSRIPGPQIAPSVRLNLNQTVLHPGDTLIVTAHASNGPSLAIVEFKTWLQQPDGRQNSLLNPHYKLKLAPNDEFSIEI